MPFPDTTVQVTPGTSASFAIERIKGTLFQPTLQADGYGEIIGRRDTYVVSDRRTYAPGANAWLLILRNDATATFVEVSHVSVTMGSSVAITGLPTNFKLQRVTFKTGGTLATAIRFDTNSPDLAGQIRIRATRRPSSATTAGAITTGWINPEETVFVGNNVLFSERDHGEPILLRNGQGIGVQTGNVAPVATLAIDTKMVFRTRYL